MLNVEWIEQGTALPEPYLYFGFNELAEIMAGQVTVGFREPGVQAVHKSTLAIYDDFDPKDAAMLAEYAVFEKGDPDDGSARLVYPLLNSPLLPFRAGLTVHQARGSWSSLPHEFEREEILTPRPAPFYEKFCYITEPAGGWGIQTRIGHLYNEYLPKSDIYPYSMYGTRDFETVNDIVVIRDRDILDIPLGSHPVVASPGMRLAYIWVYWCDTASLKRRVKFQGGRSL